MGGEAGNTRELLPVNVELNTNLLCVVESLAKSTRDVASTFAGPVHVEIDAEVVEIGSSTPPVAKQMQPCIRGWIAWRRCVALPCQRIHSTH